MPHIHFRGIDKEILIKNSTTIIDSLSNIIDCNRDWITIEHQQTEYIFDGKIVPGYIFVEIFWFPREQSIKDAVAKFLTDFCREISKQNDITVIFHTLEKDSYYDNGEHF